MASASKERKVSFKSPGGTSTTHVLDARTVELIAKAKDQGQVLGEKISVTAQLADILQQWDPQQHIDALISSKECLERFRESFTLQDARKSCESDRKACSLMNIYCGACVDVLCGKGALFQPEMGLDSDKACRTIYRKKTNRKCYASVVEASPEDLRSPVMLTVAPPCPDYASSNPDPKGADGDKGGNQFVMVPTIVQHIQPLVILLEEVANIINFEKEVVQVMLGLQDDCGLVVHSGILSMQEWDIEHCDRLIILGISESLGALAKCYQFQSGEFSDSVAYTAGDVTAPISELPLEYKRIMRDKELTP